LFTAISTTYGAGDGSTTFNLPDLRGRAVFGKDDMGGAAASRVTNSGTGNPGINGATLGAAGGVDRHTLTTAQMPTHNHTATDTEGLGTATAIMNSGALSASGSNRPQVNTSGNRWPIAAMASAGSGEAHPQMPPAIILNWIIYAGV
jgi:microcystin-dependent protein